jgi:50S ribosomal subunit-associated GTPase HflX
MLDQDFFALINMSEPLDFNYQTETAVLVGLINQEQDDEKAKEYIDELEFLAVTAGATVKGKFFQRLNSPNPVTFVGPGKLDEILKYTKLTPSSLMMNSQQHNFEILKKELNVKCWIEQI